MLLFDIIIILTKVIIMNINSITRKASFFYTADCAIEVSNRKVGLKAGAINILKDMAYETVRTVGRCVLLPYRVCNLGLKLLICLFAGASSDRIRDLKNTAALCGMTFLRTLILGPVQLLGLLIGGFVQLYSFEGSKVRLFFAEIDNVLDQIEGNFDPEYTTMVYDDDLHADYYQYLHFPYSTGPIENLNLPPIEMGPIAPMIIPEPVSIAAPAA